MQRRKFSREFKLEAVRLVKDRGEAHCRHPRGDRQEVFRTGAKVEETLYEPWTEDGIAKFRAHWPECTSPRIAFEILLFIENARRTEIG